MKKLKRNSKAWKDRVDALCERESHLCQCCGKWLQRNESAAHHIKTFGSSGNDNLDNLALVCTKCHFKIHSGNLKIKGI